MKNNKRPGGQPSNAESGDIANSFDEAREIAFQDFKYTRGRDANGESFAAGWYGAVRNAANEYSDLLSEVARLKVACDAYQKERDYYHSEHPMLIENKHLKGELLTYHRMAASGVWVPSEKYSEMIAALKWIKEKTEADPASEVELRSRASIVYSTACRALKGIE